MSGSSRKIGRNKNKPTNVAYKAQGRYDRNRRARAARHERRMEKQEVRVRRRLAAGKRCSMITLEKAVGYGVAYG